jgi:hypothetical protein
MCYPPPGTNFHLGETRSRKLPGFGEGRGGGFLESAKARLKSQQGPTLTLPEAGEGIERYAAFAAFTSFTSVKTMPGARSLV